MRFDVRMQIPFLEEASSDCRLTWLRLPRSREVKQSWITTIFTTAWAMLHSFVMIMKCRPDLLLCNGPGHHAAAADGDAHNNTYILIRHMCTDCIVDICAEAGVRVWPYNHLCGELLQSGVAVSVWQNTLLHRWPVRCAVARALSALSKSKVSGNHMLGCDCIDMLRCTETSWTSDSSSSWWSISKSHTMKRQLILIHHIGIVNIIVLLSISRWI